MEVKNAFDVLTLNIGLKYNVNESGLAGAEVSISYLKLGLQRNLLPS